MAGIFARQPGADLPGLRGDHRPPHATDRGGVGGAMIAGLISQLAQGKGFSAAIGYAHTLAANKIKQQGMNINV